MKKDRGIKQAILKTGVAYVGPRTVPTVDGVKGTVGFMLDYYITLGEDCCATTYGPEAHNEAVALVKTHYGWVASSNEIVDLWSKKLRQGG